MLVLGSVGLEIVDGIRDSATQFYTPSKTNMIMEKQPFEDVSPLKNGVVKGGGSKGRGFPNLP